MERIVMEVLPEQKQAIREEAKKKGVSIKQYILLKVLGNPVDEDGE